MSLTLYDDELKSIFHSTIRINVSKLYMRMRSIEGWCTVTTASPSLNLGAMVAGRERKTKREAVPKGQSIDLKKGWQDSEIKKVRKKKID